MKLQIREANVDDAVGIARVIVESWQKTYAGLVPDDFLELMKVSEHARGTRQLLSRLGPESHAFVAEENGRIVGSLIVTPPVYPVGHFGAEIVSFYVLPDARRRGIGSALLVECAEWLQKSGGKDVFIWLLTNSPFRSLGDRFAAEQIEGAERNEHIGESQLPLVAYAWRDLSVLTEQLTQSSRSSS